VKSKFSRIITINFISSLFAFFFFTFWRVGSFLFLQKGECRGGELCFTDFDILMLNWFFIPVFIIIPVIFLYWQYRKIKTHFPLLLIIIASAFYILISFVGLILIKDLNFIPFIHLAIFNFIFDLLYILFDRSFKD
jgi:hypothetical protein